MGLNETPSGDRLHIAILGKRNVGKSSLLNAITNQEMAVVSDYKGTTTDPVRKTMELLPIGPVVLLDTPGVDDEGELGQKRIAQTKKALRETDIALYVVDCVEGVCELDQLWIEDIKKREIPFLLIYNKADLGISDAMVKQIQEEQGIALSTSDCQAVHELRERIAKLPLLEKEKSILLSDIVKPLWQVVLVVPIDDAAPKDRLILPQQQVIRDILESGAVSMVVRDTELEMFLLQMEKKPDLVITDSQAFQEVAKVVPQEVPLTSFSILMARKKGYLKTAVSGVLALETLKDGDRILIAEGCTHHRQCMDIGTVKLPGWIAEYTKKDIQFDFCSGKDYSDMLHQYKLVIHCGGCMLNEREVMQRMKDAEKQGVPFTNYGIAIAYMNGILKRSIQMLPEIMECMN
ncbi:MAG: [FeFe] hydrogenase H-cluster maturation GTPase HydF [Eubacteriales bacterium]|nr:[FeFe] hydrogenase H-cluster maturation GTPase HydF [Eubacteriales bacterium]